jgi:simple sugar transport system ATP-binding protein
MTEVADPLTRTSTNNAHSLMSPPDLEVVSMTKRFGSFTALEDVSMKLKPGTFHALLGENGAGKSTLVKCIMGFYAPTAGEVRIDGQVRAIGSPRDAHTLRYWHGVSALYVCPRDDGCRKPGLVPF